MSFVFCRVNDDEPIQQERERELIRDSNATDTLDFGNENDALRVVTFIERPNHFVEIPHTEPGRARARLVFLGLREDNRAEVPEEQRNANYQESDDEQTQPNPEEVNADDEASDDEEQPLRYPPRPLGRPDRGGDDDDDDDDDSLASTDTSSFAYDEPHEHWDKCGNLSGCGCWACAVFVGIDLLSIMHGDE